MKNSLTVVLDANVVIPLIVPASRSTRVLHRLVESGHEVVISTAILLEVQEKLLTKKTLRKWLRVSDEEIESFVENIAITCSVIVTPSNVPKVVLADPDDDLIIAAASQCGAGYIVSEDHNLLALDGFQGIRIMTRDDFLCELDKLGVP
jgi:putative PIN family toxin of toxin-antitoxin system